MKLRALAALTVLVAACGAVDSGTGNTNWLIECKTSSECPAALTCACGLCGPSCDGALICLTSGKQPACISGSAGGPPSSGCPALPSGVRAPLEIGSSFEKIADASDVAYVLADDSGLYWQDRSYRVFGLRRGEADAELLNADATLPAPFTATVTGFVSDADAVYWGEAGVNTGPPSADPPPPPGRLHTVSKAGAGQQQLVELSSEILYPLSLESGRIMAWLEGSAARGLYAVSTSGDGVERIVYDAPLDQQPTLLQGNAYWLDAETSTLFRSGLDGSARQPLVTAGGNVRIGEGFVLWQHEQLIQDPLNLVQNFVLFDEATGCVTPMPGVGESISSEVAISPPYVYWRSFNALGSASPGQPPSTTPLIRVNLETGALERIVTSGFEMTLVDNLLAHDAQNLYVRTNAGELIAIRKP
jgi:hypothetical protein